MLENWNLVHKSRISYQDNPWRQGWPHPPGLQSGTFSVLQVWLWGWGGYWGTSKHARELKFGRQVKNHILWQSMMSRMTPSSKSPVRNLQRPSSLILRTEGVLEALLIMLESWNLVQKSRIAYHGDPWCQGWSHPQSLQSGTSNVLQVWLWGLGFLTHFYSC